MSTAVGALALTAVPCTIVAVARGAMRGALGVAPDSCDISNPPTRNVMRPERHAHVLRFEEHFITPRASFASHARCLRSAERLPQIAHVLAVDEAHARLDGG